MVSSEEAFQSFAGRGSRRPVGGLDLRSLFCSTNFETNWGSTDEYCGANFTEIAGDEELILYPISSIVLKLNPGD